MGTGASFRVKDPVQKWEDGRICCLWMMGGPGTGKTYMSSSFIEWSKMLNANEAMGKTAVVYAYLRYDQNLTEYAVVLAILVQLIWSSHQLPGVVEKVNTVLQECARMKSRPPFTQLVRLMKDVIKQFSNVRIILDGLDEMLRDLRYVIVQTFAEVEAQIVFSSRPSKLLEDAAQEEFGKRSIVFVELTAEDQDLDLFIKSSIRQCLSLRNVLTKNDAIARVIRIIKEKAKGMFLHAALQIDVLKRCRTLRDINQALANFPTKIEDLYLATLKRIYDEGDELPKLVLMWLLNIRGPITIDDLRHAVAFSPDSCSFDEDALVDEADVLSTCFGLVVVEAMTRQVRFVHCTAYEALSKLFKAQYGIDSTAANHQLIAMTCLARLVDCGFKQTDMRTLGELRAAFVSQPLLAYAYQHTSHHIRQANGAEGSLMDEAHGFVHECEAYPYFHHPNAHYTDSEPLSLLAPIHVAALLGMVDCIEGLIATQGVDVNLRSRHPTANGWTSVMIAAIKGHEDVLKLLLAHKADVNLANPWGGNALDEPAYMGHAGIVKMLCAVEGVAVNQQNKLKNTPLLIASRYGHLDIVKTLLGVPGIKINILDKRGHSPLSLASSHGYKDIVLTFLSRAEIDVNLPDFDGHPPLLLAARKGHIAIVKALLAHKQIDLNYLSKSGNSALGFAAREGYIDVVRTLLDTPTIKVNPVKKDGSSPLALACMSGHLDVVLLLLSTPGVDVNATNPLGNTPLTLASRKGHREVVKTLVAHPETKVNEITKEGMTALGLAASYGHVDVVFTLLRTSRVDANRTDEECNSPLSLACSKGHYGLVQALLSYPGTDVNHQNKLGATPLGRAVFEGHIDIVRLLLGVPDIDPNLVDNHGDSPLALACARGHFDIASALLDTPVVDVNRANNSGNSPLIHAAMSGHHQIVKALLARPETDVNRVNDAGNAALGLVARKGHHEAVRVLLEVKGLDVNRANAAGQTALAVALRKGHNRVFVELVRRLDVVVDVEGVVQALVGLAGSDWEVFGVLLVGLLRRLRK